MLTHTDPVGAARRTGVAQQQRPRPPQLVIPTFVLEVQRTHGNRAAAMMVARIQRRETGAADQSADAARRFLARHFIGTGYQRRRDIAGIATGLQERLRGQQYGLVRAVINEIESGIEDDVVSALMRLALDVDLERAAEQADGRSMLDVLYEALMTGSVDSGERKNGTRILEAKRTQQSQQAFVEGIGHRMIFPIRNIGISRMASATFRAELLTSGKVKVRYTSVKVAQYEMFADDLKTLGGWGAVREGLILGPDEVVAVRLHDEGGAKTPIDVPAIALIDFGQQIQDKTISTAATAFFIGLTLGLGALGSGPIIAVRGQVAAGEASKAALWAMRAAVWGERVAVGIQAGAMFINDRRDWILERWPVGGRTVLDAVDTANRTAGFFGSWGRLGLEALAALSNRALAASKAWKASTSERGAMKPDDRQAVRAIDDEIDLLAAELAYAQQVAAKRPRPAPAGKAGFGNTPRVIEPRRPVRQAAPDAYQYIVRDSGGTVRLKRDGHSIVCQRCAEEITWSAGIEKDYRRELKDPAADAYKTRLGLLRDREAATAISDSAGRETLSTEFGRLIDDLDAFRIRSRIMAGTHLPAGDVDALIRLADGRADVVQGLLHVARNDHRRVQALLTWSARNGSPAERILGLAKKFERRAVAAKEPFTSPLLQPYATQANMSHFLEAHHYWYFDPRAIPARPATTTMWATSVGVTELQSHLLEAVRKLKARPWHPTRAEMATSVTLDNGIQVQLGVHRDGFIGQFYPISGPAKHVEQVVWDELVEVFQVLFGQAR
jgi:hypothetical protein